MPNGMWERLRGARGVEILAALALIALLALLLHSSGGQPTAQKTELEARLERTLSGVDGAGEVRAMIAQDANGNVTGALIVSDGLEDVAAYLNLQSAVMTLLELDASRVEIIGRTGRFGGSQ